MSAISGFVFMVCFAFTLSVVGIGFGVWYAVRKMLRDPDWRRTASSAGGELAAATLDKLFRK